MKKYLILSLVAVMSLVSLVPALAHENEGKKNEVRANIEIKKELKLEIKEERKEFKDRIKELTRALRFAPRAVNLTGKLVSINNVSTSSAEITVNIARVSPNRPKNMPSSTLSYPKASTTITLKITNKTHLTKASGGRMKVSEMSVGDDLRMVVKFNTDGSLDLRELKDNSLHVLRHKKGIIESINATLKSFVLKQENRNLTVKTDAGTKFSSRGNTSTSFSNLQVGSKVMVKGVVNTNTNIVNATTVKISL